VVVFNASTSPMKEGYAVSDSNVIKLAQPGVFTDSLTEVLRSGARALLTQAVEAEVAEFLAKHADLRTATGHQRVVRHGHLPEREIMTGIGPIAVRQPRCATAKLPRASASGTRHRSCRGTRGARGA
jgi:putative transposase